MDELQFRLPFDVRTKNRHMHVDHHQAAESRDDIITSLARLYSVREDMRRAGRPVTVHCLTMAIKIRTHALRSHDAADGSMAWSMQGESRA